MALVVVTHGGDDSVGGGGDKGSDNGGDVRQWCTWCYQTMCLTRLCCSMFSLA